MAVPCSQKEGIYINPRDEDFFSIPDECNDNKTEVQEWLGPYDMITMVNQGTFMPNEFGENRIDYSSRIFLAPSDNTVPNWTQTYMNTHQLVDEIDILQIGQNTELDFYSFDQAKATYSTNDNWPTVKDNPNGRYKFNSVWIEPNQDVFITERATYSMLEWAGDVGGLFDGLVLIAGIFISPIANYSLASRFASQLQRLAQSDSK